MNYKSPPAQSSPKECIEGLIERITFHSQESGFAVLRVKVSGHVDLVTVIGTLPNVTAGEWINAQGRWAIDPKHGQQFKAELLKTTHPNTAEGIEKYLGSGLIKGIGPQFANRLVTAFGIEVLNIIESQPDRLLEVHGIGKVRLDKITSAWDEQKAVRQIMIFLHSHGVGTSRAFRIYKTYGDEAIAKVSENPYCLARDIWGIGFKTADQVASSLGIEPHSDIRARAGVEHVLQELTEEGHCAYPRNQLAKLAVKMLEIPVTIVENAIDYGLKEKRLTQHEYLDTKLVYLAAMDTSEQLLARNLVRLSMGPHPCKDINILKATEWAEKTLTITLEQTQRMALEQALQCKVMVVTGGPGVGKTTLINSVVKIFQAKAMDVKLCAPTGRAAKRMAEATGTEAKTIHRLLEFQPATATFKHNSDYPLKGDIFIVDETSMIDLILGHQFVRAIPMHAALIFVGDVDQLPSVGPGSVLKDIIESSVIPVCKLTKVFRQAAKSAIIMNSHRINNGQMPVWPSAKINTPTDTDFYFVEAQEPEKGVNLIQRLVQENIPSRFGLDPLDDIQVITPMQRGELGARNLNQVLQETLNPSNEEVQRFGWTFRKGDKVIQIVNDYDKDVFNGDIGRITSMDTAERDITVRFEDRDVKYDFEELDELVLSYAITIHKSQGSEYPCVVIPVHTQHYTLLQRNLLYTAVTRGRKLVVVVGTVKALAIAVKRMESIKRITTLNIRLTTETLT